MKQDCDLYAMQKAAMSDNRRARKESVSYGGVGTTKGNAMRSVARNAARSRHG